MQDFENWFQTPLGRALLASQRIQAERLVAGTSGAHMLEVSVSHRLPLLTTSNYGHRMATTTHWCHAIPDGVVVCDHREIPLGHDAMDLVVLHHTLDLSPHPHQALREAHRVLRGGGLMLICGFNPLSLWGIRHLFSRHKQPPWNCRFIGRTRLEDWLALLDLEPLVFNTHFFAPPLQNPGLLARARRLDNHLEQKAWWLPFGANYFLLARKRVASPIKKRDAWLAKRTRIAVPMANCTAADHKIDKLSN